MAPAHDVFDGRASIVGGVAWLPICVATLVSLATAESLRALRGPNRGGFWEVECLPRFHGGEGDGGVHVVGSGGTDDGVESSGGRRISRKSVVSAWIWGRC